MIPHIYNGNGTISLLIDGVMKPVDTAHKNYNEIKTALIEQRWDIIPDLVNIKKQVEEAINKSAAKGKVIIQHGEVFYNQRRIHNTLTNRMVSMAKEGFDIVHMMKFLENLMENPSYRAVNELYDFLESGNIPITECGTFLAYKKIREDWKDIYTGKVDNSIGAVVKMNRNEVNEDPNVTCSFGLHACSYDYLPKYGSCSNSRVIICEVNPRDVCAIPTDYNNTKMRVCEYKVIGEVKDYQQTDTLASSTVINTTDITSGKTEGTVNHLSPKQIGKDLTNILEKWYNNEFEYNKNRLAFLVANMCNEAGLDTDYVKIIDDTVFYNEYKRTGKKVAYFLTNNQMNITTFFDVFNVVKENPCKAYTIYMKDGKILNNNNTCAGECGEKCTCQTSNSCECKTAECNNNCITIKEVLCPRCKAHIKTNQNYCGICGFFL